MPQRFTTCGLHSFPRSVVDSFLGSSYRGGVSQSNVHIAIVVSSTQASRSDWGSAVSAESVRHAICLVPKVRRFSVKSLDLVTAVGRYEKEKAAVVHAKHLMTDKFLAVCYTMEVPPHRKGMLAHGFL